MRQTKPPTPLAAADVCLNIFQYNLLGHSEPSPIAQSIAFNHPKAGGKPRKVQHLHREVRRQKVPQSAEVGGNDPPQFAPGRKEWITVECRIGNSWRKDSVCSRSASSTLSTGASTRQLWQFNEAAENARRP